MKTLTPHSPTFPFFHTALRLTWRVWIKRANPPGCWRDYKHTHKLSFILGSSWVMEWSHAHLLVHSFKQLLSNTVVFVSNSTEADTAGSLYMWPCHSNHSQVCCRNYFIDLCVGCVSALELVLGAEPKLNAKHFSYLFITFVFLSPNSTFNNNIILFVFKVTTFVVPVNGYYHYWIIEYYDLLYSNMSKTELGIIDHHKAFVI